MMNEIIKELNNRGYKAESTITIKNGIEKLGVIIGEGLAKLIIYPNLDLTIDECVKEIINIYEHTPKMDTEGIRKTISWKYAKDNLQLCLQKKSKENILKRDYLDMEMYVKVKISENMGYKIKSNMFEEVNENEIFEKALSNAKENIVIEDIYNNMLVITNKSGMNGAIGIYDKKLLCNIAKKYNSNLVILPSSIHECIIYINDEPDMEVYSNMVREVNETQVAPEEVLSNHAYFFDKETCEISW